MIITYQARLWEAVRELEGSTGFGGPGHFSKLLLLDRTDGRVGVTGNFGIGAPAAATVLEELVALGVRSFLSIGLAGGLQADLAAGDVVLCDRAVRDEGVSHHYVRSEMFAHPSPGLSQAFAAALDEDGVSYRRGTTWTIDTPYRETMAEARHYQSMGVATVEMEASALFAVAEYRSVDIAAAFCVSDSLADVEWEPHFHVPELAGAMWRLFQAAVRCLAGAAAT